MKTTSAKDVISKFRNTFSTFGLPESVVTDNGPPFNSQEFIYFLTINGIEAMKSPPYYPRANGLAEVEVKLVKRALRKQLDDENGRISDEELNIAIQDFLVTYRNQPSPTTSSCPSQFMLKYAPRTIISLIRPTFGQTYCKTNNSHSFLPEHEFKAGDKVWYRGDKEWQQSKIEQVLSKSRFLINCTGRRKVAHRQQLRKDRTIEEAIPSYSIPTYVPPVTTERATAGITVDRELPTSVANADDQKLDDELTQDMEEQQSAAERDPANMSTRVIPGTELKRSQRMKHPPNRLEYSSLGQQK